MILAIDIGNSNTVFGFFQNDTLLDKIILNTNKDLSRDQYAMYFFGTLQFNKQKSINSITKKITGVIISSVVPSVNQEIKAFIEKYFNITPIFVSTRNSNLNIPEHYIDKLGSDFICNATGAFSLYKHQNIIIVDFGTATTVLTISKIKNENKIVSAIIAPGIKSSIKALAYNTAQLPEIEIQKPKNTILPTNTVESMQAGIYYGFIGLAEKIIFQIKKELNINDAYVICTGGFSNIISKEDSVLFDTINPNLILLGLLELYQYNLNNSKNPY